MHLCVCNSVKSSGKLVHQYRGWCTYTHKANTCFHANTCSHASTTHPHLSPIVHEVRLVACLVLAMMACVCGLTSVCGLSECRICLPTEARKAKLTCCVCTRVCVCLHVCCTQNCVSIIKTLAQTKWTFSPTDLNV